MARRQAVRLDYRYLAWAHDRAAGMPIERIARNAKVSIRMVQIGLKIAAEAPAPTARTDDAWWLTLLPLFPVGPFTPRSECPHRGPLQADSLFCCMVCSKSGIDDHPDLRRDPRTDPKLEPKPKPAPTPKAQPRTRRERRKAG